MPQKISRYYAVSMFFSPPLTDNAMNLDGEALEEVDILTYLGRTQAVASNNDDSL